MRPISIAIIRIPDLEKRIFWSLMVMLVMALGMYVYFVNATIMNIVGRQASQRQISSLNSRVGELESKYLALSNEITPEYAYALGFSDAKNPVYATRKAAAVAYGGLGAN